MHFKLEKTPEIIKWEFFLKEITLHLSFSYPEDDRLFFQRKNPLKAVLFLQSLSKLCLDQKEIKEAVRFCFKMYKDTLCFIAEIASAHVENQSKLLQVIQELKEQIIDLLDKPRAKKISGAQLQKSDQTLINQVNQGLDILGPLDTYSSLPDQKIYAAIGTIKHYLQLMKISLELPQDSSRHSLQKFIKVETLTNLDKLFQQLFRAVILLQYGDDSHQHTLTNLFDLTADFYKKDNKQINISHLKDINLGVSHHYLHIKKRESESELHLIYNTCLVQACSILSNSHAPAITQKDEPTMRNLKTSIYKINQLIKQSFDLFIQFLEPSLKEIKERFTIKAVT